MGFCKTCDHYYRELADEQGDHPCPRCHRLPHEREDKEQEDMDSYELAEQFVLEQLKDQIDIDVTMITVGNMRDCDCIPVDVHDDAGVRWKLVAAIEIGNQLNATYEIR
jgi:hypothetical protein